MFRPMIPMGLGDLTTLSTTELKALAAQLLVDRDQLAKDWEAVAAELLGRSDELVALANGKR